MCGDGLLCLVVLHLDPGLLSHMLLAGPETMHLSPGHLTNLGQRGACMLCVSTVMWRLTVGH